MKTKSFLLGAAAVMLATSCSNDEVVKVAENSAAIGFSSFVNNSTRADYGSENLPSNLQVYAVSSRAASEDVEAVNPFVVFNGDVVTNTGSAWTYSPLRYWIAGNDYTFAAIAPAAAADVKQGTGTTNGGIETITFTNKGNVDLLYAVYEEATKVTANRDAVNFTLGHLLSRIRFNFVNDTKSAAYAIKVKDIKINDAVTVASYATEDNVWTGSDNGSFSFSTDEAYTTENPYTLNGDDVISASQNLFPKDNTTGYNATFTVELYQITDGVYNLINAYKHDITLPEINYEAGNSYTLKASIDMTNVNPDEQIKPIEFTATVTNWEEQEANTVVLPKKEENETPAE